MDQKDNLFRPASADSIDIETALGTAKDHPIEVLDLEPVVRQAREQYRKVSERAKGWSEETLGQLKIMAMYDVGRVAFDMGDKPRSAAGMEGKDVYVFDQAGRGPEKPLAGRQGQPGAILHNVSLFASMKSHRDKDGNEVQGFVEKTPFIEVVIDRDAAVQLRTQREVSLGKFLLSRSSEHKLAVIARARLIGGLVEKAKRRSVQRRQAAQASKVATRVLGKSESEGEDSIRP